MKKLVIVFSVLVFVLSLTVSANGKDNPFKKILKNIDSMKTSIRNMNPNNDMKKIKKLKKKIKKEETHLTKTLERVTAILSQKIDMLEAKQEKIDPEKNKEKFEAIQEKIEEISAEIDVYKDMAYPNKSKFSLSLDNNDDDE